MVHNLRLSGNDVRSLMYCSEQMDYRGETTRMTDEGRGVHYNAERQFLIVEGVIARDIPSFPLAARPKRKARAVAFDSLAGNTTMGIHVSEVPPGGPEGWPSTSRRGHLLHRLRARLVRAAPG